MNSSCKFLKLNNIVVFYVEQDDTRKAKVFETGSTQSILHENVFLGINMKVIIFPFLCTENHVLKITAVFSTTIYNSVLKTSP